MQFAQLCDLVEPPLPAGAAIDAEALPGNWINSNPDTNGIARLIVSKTGETLSMQAFAIGPEGLVDWGTAPMKVFAASASSLTGAGFSCVFDFGFAESRLQGMMMKGLMVLTQCHSFKDDSKRAAYFVREYFALEHGRF